MHEYNSNTDQNNNFKDLNEMQNQMRLFNSWNDLHQQAHTLLNTQSWRSYDLKIL